MADKSLLIGLAVAIVVIVVVIIVCEFIVMSRIREYCNKFKDIDLVEEDLWDGVDPSDPDNCGKKRLEDICWMFAVVVVLSLLLAVPTAYVIKLATDSTTSMAVYLILAVWLVFGWGVQWYYLRKIGNNKQESQDSQNNAEGQNLCTCLDVGHAPLDFANFSLLGPLLHAIFAVVAAVMLYRYKMSSDKSMYTKGKGIPSSVPTSMGGFVYSGNKFVTRY